MITYLLSLLLVSAIIVIVKLLNRRSPTAISKELEDHVASVLAHAGDGELPIEEDGVPLFQPGMSTTRFQGKMVAIAKAEFGYLQRSKANRAMVRKFMRDYMRENGMRPTHIAQHLDVSVAVFFIPSHQDMMAHQVGATKDAHDRDGVMREMWESYFGPLGRMLGFKDD